MFAYVDPEIRRKLEHDHRLVNLDEHGEVLDEPNGGFCISMLGPIPMPRLVGGVEHVFHWYAFVRRTQLKRVLDAANQARSGGEEAFRELIQSNMSVNSIIASPRFLTVEKPLVRVHSCCMTGDIFGSMRCECGPQLDTAFERIIAEGGGAVVYMSGHEGRGIGLWAKAITYLLQDDGQDTYQANRSLGLPDDSRDFTDAAVVLRHLLRGEPLRLLSNNPMKRDHLQGNGQPVAEMVSFNPGVCSHNLRYMRAKRDAGHQLPEGL